MYSLTEYHAELETILLSEVPSYEEKAQKQSTDDLILHAAKFYCNYITNCIDIQRFALNGYLLWFDSIDLRKLECTADQDPDLKAALVMIVNENRVWLDSVLPVKAVYNLYIK
jgi:hypothetical protein